MKKILTLLGAVVVLAGCDLIGGGEEKTSSNESSSTVDKKGLKRTIVL